MERKYFALTGNEFGVHLPNHLNLLTEDEATKEYLEMVIEYGCAGLYKVEDGQITMVRQEAEF